MGAFQAVVASTLVLGACTGPEGPKASDALGVGDPFPAVGLAGDRPGLVWVFDAQECLGCNLTEPAWAVRDLQRRLGDRFETVAVAVGEQGEDDRDMVGNFLASQRVSAEVEVRTRRDYSRDFGSALAVFYVINMDSKVEAVVATSAAETWRSALDSLDLACFVAGLADRDGGAQ